MLKTLAKMAEKYAKSTNAACVMMGVFHQPKMPASLIKKTNKLNWITTIFHIINKKSTKLKIASFIGSYF